jgi:hypothetical protein
MGHHAVYFVTENLKVILYPFGLDRIATRYHTQGRKRFFEEVEFGIIDAEEVQRVYTVYVDADFCQVF